MKRSKLRDPRKDRYGNEETEFSSIHWGGGGNKNDNRHQGGKENAKYDC